MCSKTTEHYILRINEIPTAGDITGFWCKSAHSYLAFLLKDFPYRVISRGARLPLGEALGQNRVITPLKISPHPLSSLGSPNNSHNYSNIDQLVDIALKSKLNLLLEKHNYLEFFPYYLKYQASTLA